VNILDPRILAGEVLSWTEEREKYQQTKIEPLHDLYRLSDHVLFTDSETRRGFSMHSSEFIARVQKLNPLIYVRHQLNFEDDWGLYADIGGKLVYLSGFPKGWMSEFSWAPTDERDLPTEEKRGWRTVLVLLMGKGLLTYPEVVEEFGESEGFNSERWAVYTQPYRNRDEGQVVALNISNAFE
jgi:hypothetical protein